MLLQISTPGVPPIQSQYLIGIGCCKEVKRPLFDDKRSESVSGVTETTRQSKTNFLSCWKLWLCSEDFHPTKMRLLRLQESLCVFTEQTAHSKSPAGDSEAVQWKGNNPHLPVAVMVIAVSSGRSVKLLSSAVMNTFGKPGHTAMEVGPEMPSFSGIPL